MPTLELEQETVQTEAVDLGAVIVPEYFTFAVPPRAEPEPVLNVAMLRRVQAMIMADPLLIDMREWMYTPEDLGLLMGYIMEDGEVAAFSTCRTAGCIAGWTVLLAELDHHHGDGTDIQRLHAADVHDVAYGCLGYRRLSSSLFIAETAAEILGLPMALAEKLFYTPKWPWDFVMRLYDVRRGTAEYAEVVCQRIDHLIECGA